MVCIFIALLCAVVVLLNKIDYYNTEFLKSQAKVESLEYQLHLKEIEMKINKNIEEIK